MKVAFLMVNSSSAAVHNNRTDHHYHHQTSEVATTSSFSFMATGNSGITSTAAVRQHNFDNGTSNRKHGNGMTTHRKNTYPAAEATTGGGYIYSDTHSRKNTEGGGGYREREHPRMSGKLSETATAGSLGGGGRGEYGSNDHQQGPSLETVFTLHIANLCLAIPPVVCLSGATLDIRQILRPMKIARDLGFELNGLTKHVRGIIDSA